VKTGNKQAKTIAHPLIGKNASKDVVWQEDFIMEFDHLGAHEEKVFLEVLVFSKKDLLGILKLTVDDISPAEEIWEMIKPVDFPLSDPKGNQIGTVNLRIRHENKIFGTLVVNLKEGDLEKDISGDIMSVMAVIKHTDQISLTQPAIVNDNHFVFLESCSKSIILDKKNNVFDVFIELWKNDPNPNVSQVKSSAILEPAPTAPIPEKKKNLDPTALVRGNMIGQARLPLFDVRLPFQSLQIFSEHKRVGQIQVQTRLTDING
jgi:predicted secreted protein